MSYKGIAFYFNTSLLIFIVLSSPLPSPDKQRDHPYPGH